MKKQRLIVILIAIVIILILYWNKENETYYYYDSLVVDTLVTKEINVLEDVYFINQDTSLKFPTNFKEGHVKNKRIKDYLKLTDYGFHIRTTSGTNIPTPLIVEEKIFLSGGFKSKEYFCFDVKNGKNIWAVSLDDDGPSSAVYSDSTIYFNTESCTIFALDYSNGKSKWSFWLGDPLLTRPNISGDIVLTTYPYIPNIDSTKLKSLKLIPSHPLIGFDKKSGKIEWQKWLDGDIIGHPIVNDSIAFVVTFPGTLYKIESKTGEILSSIKLGATSTPTIKGQHIYITKRNDDSISVKESIAILDYQTLGFIKEFNSSLAPYLDFEKQKNTKLKNEADTLDMGNGFFTTPITSGWKLASKNIGQSNVSSLQMFQGSQIKFKGDTLYTFKGNILYSINSQNEEILWTDTLSNKYLNLGGFGATPVVLNNDQIIIVTIEGQLRIYNGLTGILDYSYQFNQMVRSKPLIENNWIYIPTTKGELICVDLNKIKGDT